jgi:hypothetical protein
MRNTTIISIITLCLSLIGCGDEPQKTPPTPEVKPPAPVVENKDESGSTGTSEHVETITLAGNTFRVTVKGSIAPSAVLDVSIVQTSGTPAAAIRVWIGDASGVGSVKTKSHSHGASSHVHAQAPAKLPANSELWIEVQNADGTSGSGSVELN